MSSGESEQVRKKQNNYYRDNWHRALLSTCLYTNPEVANADVYTLASFNPEKDPIYFYVDFLKPGKNTYLIEHFTRKPKIMGTIDFFFDNFRESNPNMDNPKLTDDDIDKNFYVHNMLS